MTPRYGWYGDDFTGATDTLATLAAAGQRAVLFLGVPEPRHLVRAGPLDAVGIAGAARAMAPAEMRRALEPVGRFLAGLGVAVLHYKCCSTFDSAPGIGSIGAAISVLRPYMPNPFVPVIGGQPNIGRYCAFSTLFARAGAGGGVSRLDRHPTMSVHPVTPMHEADLRLHLAAQGCGDVTGVHLPAYADAGSLDAAVRGMAGVVLFDLVAAEQVPLVGRVVCGQAARRPLLAVGPSSVAQVVMAGWGAAGGAGGRPVPLGPAAGPVLVLAGSLSPVTRRQVRAAAGFAPVAIEADRLLDEPGYEAVLAGEVARWLRAGHSVLACTAAEPPADTSRAVAVAAATARLLPAILARVPVRRVGVAGGDTSSHAVAALGACLGVWGLSHAMTLAPGVAVCRVHADRAEADGMELMLKGGQMGPEDVFARLVSGEAVEAPI